MTTEKKDHHQTFIQRMISPIKKRDRDENKKKFESTTPHPNLHNYHTIKWLRNRFNLSVFNRSINTMLPNNGIPVEDENEEKGRLDFAKEFLTTYCQGNDKFQNIHITPKYFYSSLVMTKIKKLLDIFIEFDGDGSCKLEIDEMVEMFNTNKIPVDEAELISLFFKDKKWRKDEEPYLDFYQFMTFALSKACDQDFRSFMRKLKKKKVEETQKNNHQSDRNKNDEEDNLFLPMNFNLVLDYFNNKGKQRESQNKIQEAIEIMDNIMNPKKEEHESGLNNLKREATINSEAASLNTEENNKNEFDPNDVDRELEIHNKIDTESLFDEFKKLFGQKHATENSNNTIRIARKMMGIATESEQSSGGASARFSRLNTIGKVLPTHITTMNTRTINSDGGRSNPQEMNHQNNGNQMQFTNFIKSKIDKDEINKSSLKMYEKYKSLYIAAEETKKKIDGNKLISPSSTLYSNFRTTANGTKPYFNQGGKNNKFQQSQQGFNNMNHLNRGKSGLINNLKNQNQNGPNDHKSQRNLMNTQSDKFGGTTNTFYNLNSHRSNKIESAKTFRSKDSIPHLPEIMNKKIQNDNDYIPMKLLQALRPGMSNSRSNSNLNNSDMNYSVRK